MAFDKNNPADLAALKTEVTTDPIGMGYAAVIEQTQPLLKLLNDADNNVGGDTAARPFDVLAMLDALDPTDFDAQQTAAGAANFTHTLVDLAGYEDISPYKAKWASMFAGNSATVTALNAQTAPLSRAEVLFGQGTTITRDDWIAARDS